MNEGRPGGRSPPNVVSMEKIHSNNHHGPMNRSRCRAEVGGQRTLTLDAESPLSYSGHDDATHVPDTIVNRCVAFFLPPT